MIPDVSVLVSAAMAHHCSVRYHRENAGLLLNDMFLQTAINSNMIMLTIERVLADSRVNTVPHRPTVKT